MKVLIFILLLIIPLACCAAVYMQTDANGNVSFSDIPQDANAKAVDLPQVNAAPGPAPVQPVAATPAQAQPVTAIPVSPVNKPYVLFDIDSPANQATIQNQPSIPIEIKIDPPLQTGDKVQIYLDGSPWGPAAPTTHFIFNAPDRGTHTLSARLMNISGQILKETDTITIYIHQAHNGGAT